MGGTTQARFPPLADLRAFVSAQLTLFRGDHLRPLNPTPYKISVSTELYHFTHECVARRRRRRRNCARGATTAPAPPHPPPRRLLMKEVPIAELE